MNVFEAVNLSGIGRDNDEYELYYILHVFI
jgi:hypothetical protein